MKLIQIHYFLSIAACKSITKAAEQLYVSQPAVTKQMNQLEEELGVKLMNRTPSGIELTGVGEEFAKDMKAVMEEFDNAVAKAMSAGNKKPEELRIGCFDGAVTDDFLPDLYDNLKIVMPTLRIRLGRHPIYQTKKALEADQIDMMISIKLPYIKEWSSDPAFCSKTLVRREGALIFSKHSPLAKKKKLTPKDFEKETLFVVEEETGLTESCISTMKDLGIESPVVEKADNFVSMLSNIRLGMGYTALAKKAADSDPDLRAFPLPEKLGMEVFAVWKKKNLFVTNLMKKIYG